MDFYKKFLLILVIVIPFSTALAESEDYLLVNIQYQKSIDKIEVINVKQRVFDSSDVFLLSDGEYELILTDLGCQLLSSNTFRLVLTGEFEGIPLSSNDEYDYSSSPPDFYSATVDLPLTQSIEAKKANLFIKKDGKILFNKKLSDLPFEVLGVKANEVSVQEPEPVFPPFPKEGIKKSIFNLSNPLFWIIILGAVGLFIILWFLFHNFFQLT